jgi:hypothetical protein
MSEMNECDNGQQKPYSLPFFAFPPSAWAGARLAAGALAAGAFAAVLAAAGVRSGREGNLAAAKCCRILLPSGVWLVESTRITEQHMPMRAMITWQPSRSSTSLGLELDLVGAWGPYLPADLECKKMSKCALRVD